MDMIIATISMMIMEIFTGMNVMTTIILAKSIKASEVERVLKPKIWMISALGVIGEFKRH